MTVNAIYTYLTNLTNLFAQDEKKTEERQLMYISEKGEHSCKKCIMNHGKKYKESDLEKPALPIHPNCRCYYQYVDNGISYCSVTVRVDDSPGWGGIRVSGIDDMLNKLEKAYAAGTLKELIISNHGSGAGRYPMGNNDDLIYMTAWQAARLRRLLASDAIVDIRMCYSSEGIQGAASAEKLANLLVVNIRGYEGPVSPYGTRPSAVKKDKVHNLSYFQRIYPDHKPKIFKPAK